MALLCVGFAVYGVIGSKVWEFYFPGVLWVQMTSPGSQL